MYIIKKSEQYNVLNLVPFMNKELPNLAKISN